MKAQKWEAETEEDISEACSTEEKESLVLCSSQLHFRGHMSGFNRYRGLEITEADIGGMKAHGVCESREANAAKAVCVCVCVCACVCVRVYVHVGVHPHPDVYTRGVIRQCWLMAQER